MILRTQKNPSFPKKPRNFSNKQVKKDETFPTPIEFKGAVQMLQNKGKTLNVGDEMEKKGHFSKNRGENIQRNQIKCGELDSLEILESQIIDLPESTIVSQENKGPNVEEAKFDSLNAGIPEEIQIFPSVLRLGAEIREIEDLSMVKKCPEKVILVVDTINFSVSLMTGLLKFLLKAPEARDDLRNTKKIEFLLEKDDTQVKKLLKKVMKLKGKAVWVDIALHTGMKTNWLSEPDSLGFPEYLSEQLSGLEYEREWKQMAKYPVTCMNQLKSIRKNEENVLSELVLAQFKEKFRKEEAKSICKAVKRNKKSLKGVSIAIR